MFLFQVQNTTIQDILDKKRFWLIDAAIISLWMKLMIILCEFGHGQNVNFGLRCMTPVAWYICNSGEKNESIERFMPVFTKLWCIRSKIHRNCLCPTESSNLCFKLCYVQKRNHFVWEGSISTANKIFPKFKFFTSKCYKNRNDFFLNWNVKKQTFLFCSLQSDCWVFEPHYRMTVT